MSAEFRSSIRGLILDMDGVLWRGSQPIGNLPKIFDCLKQSNLKVVLATNNATRTPDQHLEHIAGFGVGGLEDWQVVTSAQATINLLAEHFPDRGPVYVVGEPALLEVLQQAGFHHSEKDALAVVAGIDKSFTYAKLVIAQRLILNGALFFATNTDRTFPIPGGLAPGAGSLIAAIQAATNTEPIIAGKPSPEMYQIALGRMAIEPSQALVVGDRLETDMSGAQALGCRTAVVLSGVSTKEQIDAWQPAPDLVMPDLSTTLEWLGIA